MTDGRNPTTKTKPMVDGPGALFLLFRSLEFATKSDLVNIKKRKAPPVVTCLQKPKNSRSLCSVEILRFGKFSWVKKKGENKATSGTGTTHSGR